MARPSGSKNKPIRDLRPTIMKMLVRALGNRKTRKEIEEYLDGLPVGEKVQWYMTMARIGINASPKTTEVEGAGGGFNLYINGILQKGAIDQSAVDVTPLPRTLPSPPVDWSRLPAGKSEKCDALRDLKKAPAPAPPDEDAPLPPGTQIFRVPFGPDEDGIPPEWRADIHNQEEE